MWLPFHLKDILLLRRLRYCYDKHLIECIDEQNISEYIIAVVLML